MRHGFVDQGHFFQREGIGAEGEGEDFFDAGTHAHAFEHEPQVAQADQDPEIPQTVQHPRLVDQVPRQFGLGFLEPF